MHWFDICIIVLVVVIVLMYLACAVDFYITTCRYKKFYEITEEGKKLYCAQYTLDRLGSKHDFIKNRMQTLRDKINEYTTYMPDENENREILRELKLQYHYNNEELKWTKEAMVDWGKRIEKMVAALPKKYNGILEYDWTNAKVEVKEESVCW